MTMTKNQIHGLTQVLYSMFLQGVEDGRFTVEELDESLDGILEDVFDMLYADFGDPGEIIFEYDDEVLYDEF